jgi:hypothetical protein
MNDISTVIYALAYAMDTKNWEQARSCLLDTLTTDYADLRGEPPSQVSADDYIEKRKTALASLRTQHLSTNHLITLNGDDHATCIAQGVIFRYHPRTADYFHTHCIYTYQLQLTPDGWKISSIKQSLLWNEGNPALHSGARGTV